MIEFPVTFRRTFKNRTFFESTRVQVFFKVFVLANVRRVWFVSPTCSFFPRSSRSSPLAEERTGCVHFASSRRRSSRDRDKSRPRSPLLYARLAVTAQSAFRERHPSIPSTALIDVRAGYCPRPTARRRSRANVPPTSALSRATCSQSATFPRPDGPVTSAVPVLIFCALSNAYMARRLLAALLGRVPSLCTSTANPLKWTNRRRGLGFLGGWVFIR